MSWFNRILPFQKRKTNNGHAPTLPRYPDHPIHQLFELEDETKQAALIARPAGWFEVWVGEYSGRNPADAKLDDEYWAWKQIGGIFADSELAWVELSAWAASRPLKSIEIPAAYKT